MADPQEVTQTTPVTQEGATPQEGQTSALTLEEVKKMIQSETDKVRTEYSQRLKQLKDEKEALVKEKMSEEEKRKYETEKAQKELQEKERALKERELHLLTVDLLKEAEMPLDFRPFVVGQDEDSTKERVATLKKIWTDALKTEVEGKFKQSGRTPAKGEPPKGRLEQLEAELAKATNLEERMHLRNEIHQLQSQLKE